ncbi:MAG TPA: MoaD/ThiS family protein [Gemmatimonadales bacterium]
MSSPPSALPVIRVHLFASYAERLGRDYVELPAEGHRTAGEVLESLRSLPSGAALGSAALIAINLRQVSLDAPVVPGDEVAILPPLAGG